jgi:hypothetical protein
MNSNFIIRWSLTAVLGAAALYGQTAAPAKPQSPATTASVKLSELRNKPEYIGALIDYIHKFPDTPTAEQSMLSLRYSIPKEYTTEQVRPLMDKLIEGIADTEAVLRMRLYGDMCSYLASRELWPELVTASSRSIPLADEKSYVEFDHRVYEQQMAAAKERNPDFKPQPFREADTKSRFLPYQASLYAYEARGYMEQGKLAEADVAYHKAYDIKVTADGAWGLGRVLEKRGKEAEALPYMTTAFLTGKLKTPDIEHFHALFTKLRPGQSEDAYLDAEFLKTYKNPVPETKYTPTAARTNRTVLAEFFTGGGCVPCVPFDYSFERVLEAYSAKEVVLLVDHWHAPVEDPLGNHGVDNRVKYYGIKGAPTTIIQGKRLNTKDDNAREEEKAEVAPRVFKQIRAVIDPALETPPGAELAGTASRSGDSIQVTVTPSKFAKTEGKFRLQIALVEKEVSYSGENGLRMQMNVVRNLAGSAKTSTYGFAVDAAKPAPVNYSFDLKQITAENLRYYDEYPEERKAEIAGEGRAAVIPMLTFGWREHKNIMDPGKLFVAAYLQDEESKDILQAVMIPVNR